MIVCSCFGVTDREFLEACNKQGLQNGAELRACMAGNGCGCCRPTLEALAGKAGEAQPGAARLREADKPAEQAS
ncbi:MAG: (2Fe-2S)-binding protein [Planctomycetota bacterium]